MAKTILWPEVGLGLLFAAGLVFSIPAFEEFAKRRSQAQASQALEDAEEEDSNTALFRVKNGCTIPRIAETGELINTISTGWKNPLINPNGSPLGVGLRVCARDGSTAITTRVVGGVSYGHITTARPDDMEKYQEYYQKNLESQEGGGGSQ